MVMIMSKILTRGILYDENVKFVSEVFNENINGNFSNTYNKFCQYL